MALQSPESLPVVLECFSRLTFAKKRNCEYIRNLYGSKLVLEITINWPISNKGMTFQPFKEMQQIVVHVFDCFSLFSFAHKSIKSKTATLYVCHRFYEHDVKLVYNEVYNFLYWPHMRKATCVSHRFAVSEMTSTEMKKIWTKGNYSQVPS